MERTANTMDRLYELYQQHINRLHLDVTAVNRSLASSEPEKTRLEPLTRRNFEVFLKSPTDDPEAMRLWMRRIIRGHEQEFPGLLVAGNSVRVTDADTHDRQSQQDRRGTGT